MMWVEWSAVECGKEIAFGQEWVLSALKRRNMKKGVS
jgi:hypothetical protein